MSNIKKVAIEQSQETLIKKEKQPVQFNKTQNLRFILIPFYKEMDEGNEPLQKCMIGYKFVNTGFTKVHGGFSELVFTKIDKDYGTMKDLANTVIRFLNYTLENNSKYKLKTFSDLSEMHGVDYLNNLTTKKVSAKYWHKEDNKLNDLYMFLVKKGVMNNVKLKDWERNNRNTKRKIKGRKFKSLFKKATPPPNRGDNPLLLKNLDIELINTFFTTAIRYTPRIALGIYFEIFGGLRCSEVVSVNRLGISYAAAGRMGLEVRIADHIYRPDLLNPAGAGVKVPRTQKIDAVPGSLLPYLLKTHLKKYIATDGTNAMFSIRNGKAMTPKAYRYYFDKFKEAFIKAVENSDITEFQEYAQMLRIRKWNSHIGRGIFSNIKAEVYQNSLMLQIDRGDADPRSSAIYVQATKQRINERSQAIYGMLSDEGFFDED